MQWNTRARTVVAKGKKWILQQHAEAMVQAFGTPIQVESAGGAVQKPTKTAHTKRMQLAAKLSQQKSTGSK